MTVSPDPSEAATRRRLIDPLLTAAGWAVGPYAPLAPLPPGAAALTEFPTANGPADYALVRNGAVVGIVEAKKLAVGAGGVLVQAERYARGLPPGPYYFGGLRTPFMYATNGETIRFHDVRHPRHVGLPARPSRTVTIPL